MPQDPNAVFDDSVMEMIEHSPIGAVPHTTSYVESLARLHAANKVYPSADHKGGHVTSRSLSGSPCFLATNLEALAAGTIPPEALEPNAKIFDRYLQSLPAAFRPLAEAHRIKVTGKPIHHRKHHGGEAAVHHDPVHSLFLVPGTGAHHGLPGNYLYGSVFQTGPAGASGGWAIHLHDADDGASFLQSPDLPTAVATVTELIGTAPFHLRELEAFGFKAI
jgi:hypothetical protein